MIVINNKPTNQPTRTTMMMMKRTFTIIIPLLLTIIWSLQSIDTLEIWSVYFDETQELITTTTTTDDNNNTTNCLIRQIVSIPFDDNDQQIRYINEIRTYIENGDKILRMELILCDEIIDNDVDDDRMINEELIFMDKNETKYVCIQRLSTAKWPNLEHNQTLIQYPANVGLAFNHYRSMDSGKQTLLLMIEYLNDFYDQIIDHSGFDLYLLDETEITIEAGIIAIGIVPDSFFFIPPKLNHWSMKGVCNTNVCIQNQIDNEIRIVSVIAGTNHHYIDEMIVEIIDHQKRRRRQQIFSLNNNGGEQRTFEMLIESPIIKTTAMDKIIVECNYINTSNRTVKAGFDDKNENCLVWLHHYPRIDGLDACLSTHSLATIMSLLDLNDLNVTLTRSNGIDLRIPDNNHGSKQMNLNEFLNEKDQNHNWNVDKLIRAKYNAMKGRQISSCGWNPMKIDLNRRRRRRR
ncbi:uncharacterized protein LOC124497418 isoform X3 [Dermatophagoides farinae]|uniref:uncharacterized protein LOC124497418 isoform X3 n=1 Tax=Dermatophagoides farinae TaxID=6954 RepID=UPI003F635486